MNYYVCTPGVLGADEVSVDSTALRETYIDKLCEFAGCEYREIFENKIKVRKNISQTVDIDRSVCENGTEKSDVKKILVYFSNCMIDEYGEKAETKIERVRKYLDERKDVCSYNLFVGEIPSEINAVRDYDAYYGSPSTTVMDFVNAGKPVMIADAIYNPL